MTPADPATGPPTGPGPASPSGSWGPLLHEVVAETWGLLAPRRCPCGREGTRLCPRCAATLTRGAVRVDAACDALQGIGTVRVREGAGGEPAGVDHVPLLPVLALGPYRGPLREVVLAWKNRGASCLVPALAAGLGPAVLALAGDAGPVGLAAVPSTWAARRRRGEDHVAELVRALAAAGAGHDLRVRATPSGPQEGGGARRRRTRRITVQRVRDPAGPVVLVDDVVTTGASLRALHGALTERGARVVGAVVVAAARVPAPTSVPGSPGPPTGPDRAPRG